MLRKSIVTASSLSGLLLISAIVFAKPAFVKQYNDQYKDKGGKATCKTCHTTAPKLNDYGDALKKALKGGKALTPEIFKAAEAKRPKA